MGYADPKRTDDSVNPAEARAQRTLQAAQRLLARLDSPSAASTKDELRAHMRTISAEDELRHYMEKMTLPRYNHARELLSNLYREN